MYLILMAFAVSFIYPFLWMGAISLKPASELTNLSLFSENQGVRIYVLNEDLAQAKKILNLAK